MIDDMSLKNKNVINLPLNVEMFSCRIIFAFYYNKSFEIQKYQLKINHIICKCFISKASKDSELVRDIVDHAQQVMCCTEARTCHIPRRYWR